MAVKTKKNLNKQRKTMKKLRKQKKQRGGEGETNSDNSTSPWNKFTAFVKNSAATIKDKVKDVMPGTTPSEENKTGGNKRKNQKEMYEEMENLFKQTQGNKVLKNLRKLVKQKGGKKVLGKFLDKN